VFRSKSVTELLAASLGLLPSTLLVASLDRLSINSQIAAVVRLSKSGMSDDNSDDITLLTRAEVETMTGFKVNYKVNGE
jgi:hypothetical protein